MKGPFERVRFLRETSDGVGKFSAEAACWFRNTRCTQAHANPDYRGYGAGASPEEARSDAVRSAISSLATDMADMSYGRSR